MPCRHLLVVGLTGSLAGTGESVQDNGGDGGVPDGEAPSGREEGAGVTGLDWRGRCAREPERGRPRRGKVTHQTGSRGMLDEKRRSELAQELRSDRGAGQRPG